MAASVLTNSFASFLHRPKPTSKAFTPSLYLHRFISTSNVVFYNNKLQFPSNSVRFSRRIFVGTSFKGESDETGGTRLSVAEEDLLVREDSVFELGNQKITSWIYSSVVLGVVLFILDVVWIDNSTGFGKAFVDAVSTVSESHEVVMLALIFVFAAVHSGLASFRDAGEKLIGECAFFVLFAGLSLRLAVTTVVYFINHRYDGIQLCQLQGVPGIQELVRISKFISFMFLYPSTFNLLEVAAVDKPKMHLWETGIMGITRHPQIMLLRTISILPASWNLFRRGVCLSTMWFERDPSSTLKSHNLGLKVMPQTRRWEISNTVNSANESPKQGQIGKREQLYSQNVDLPPILPKNKKKPYPIPLKKIQQAGRKNKKLAQMGIEMPLEPPENGLIVPDLIPVAYQVLDAWKIVIQGLSQLLHVVAVYGCSECHEIHVAEAGHQIQNCHGPRSSTRRSFHSWVKGSINDILLPIESYHMYDPFGRRIKHETRFDYDRIPAVVELCIQAGVELTEYPSRRRSTPIRIIGKKVIDRGGFVEEPKPLQSEKSYPSLVDLDTHGAFGRFPAPSRSDASRIAQETIDAYEVVRDGVSKLMRKYRVKACGYCSEIHVGPWGHNVKLCGEFKHQWRDGKHGWQDATVDEVICPNYVWHVEDPKGPPLRGQLKRFYGKAPAIVEVCMQGGAVVPDKYKAMMRLDIVVPETEEAGLVA